MGAAAFFLHNSPWNTKQLNRTQVIKVNSMVITLILSGIKIILLEK